MGSAKPLLRWRNATLLQHACAAARQGGADPILVVADDPPWLQARAGDVGNVDWVRSSTPISGQSHSLRAGLAAATEAAPDAAAVLIVLVDQVGLREEAVRLILSVVASSGADAWVADYGVRPRAPGHPVALGRPTWPLVERLRGDSGARAFLTQSKTSPTKVEWVPMPQAWRPLDCDTPDDYRRLLTLDSADPQEET